MNEQSEIRIFEQARPRLLGLAYRMLGVRADAEDAVQDTYLKWRAANREAIRTPAAWLVTACTRRCLDLMRAADRARVDYVGEWLPEPVITEGGDDPEHTAEMASSLTTAFLLMLQRLTPKERAAYLLHEIFDYGYDEVADMLDMQPSACRKLVSRARANIDQDQVRHALAPERQSELLTAFQTAMRSGSASSLAALLSEEIRFTSDGGGKVPALLRTLEGVDEVMILVENRLMQWWSGYEWIEVELNGTPGLVLKDGDEIAAAATFHFDEAGRIDRIFVVRNPDKLTGLGKSAIH